MKKYLVEFGIVVGIASALCGCSEKIDTVSVQDKMWRCETTRNGNSVWTRNMFGSNGRFVTATEGEGELRWILGGYEISKANELIESNVGLLDNSTQQMIGSTFRPGVNFTGIITRASAEHLEFNGKYMRTVESSKCIPLKGKA